MLKRFLDWLGRPKEGDRYTHYKNSDRVYRVVCVCWFPVWEDHVVFYCDEAHYRKRWDWFKSSFLPVSDRWSDWLDVALFPSLGTVACSTKRQIDKGYYARLLRDWGETVHYKSAIVKRFERVQ